MARLTAVLLAAACSLSWAGHAVVAADSARSQSCTAGSPAGRGVCQDAAADGGGADGASVELLQVHKQQQRRSGSGALTAGAEQRQQTADSSAEAQFPGLSGILDVVNNTANTLTDSVSSVAGSMGKSVFNDTGIFNDTAGALASSISSVADNIGRGVSNATGTAATVAAKAVAAALNQTLLAVDAQADRMINASRQAKAALALRMEQAGATLREKAEALEGNATAAVDSVLPLWADVSASVRATSAAAATSLTAAGFADLAQPLDAKLVEVLAEADEVAASLENVTGLLRNVSRQADDEMRRRLDSIQGSLELGMERADHFARNFSLAFADLTDEAATKIAQTVPGANAAEIDAAFDSVDVQVAALAGKLVEAPEVLVSAVSDATDGVQEKLPGGRSAAYGLRPCAALVLAAGVLLAGM